MTGGAPRGRLARVRSWTWCLLVAGCGAPPAPPAAPLGNAGGDAETRVYAWSGRALDPLYCVRGGRLDAAACAWAASLDLPDGVRAAERDDEGAITYGPRRGATRETVLVVERDGVVTAWGAPFTGDPLLGVLPAPDYPALRVDDALNVAAFQVAPPEAAPPDLEAVLGGQPPRTYLRVDTPSGPRSITIVGDGTPVPYAALDLDADGAPELVYHHHDDDGPFAAVVELSDDAEPFAARRY